MLHSRGSHNRWHNRGAPRPPVRLIGETRKPRPCKPGHPAVFDYEYRRHGVADLLVAMDAHRGWRHVEVSERHTKADFARFMRELVHVHYADAKRIHVVLDNYGTHTMAALYESFSPIDARRLARKLQFHFLPKHASSLNMAELEIGVLKRQCLDRRIDDRSTLRREIEQWQRDRNAKGARVRWMFSVERARQKMAASYPGPPTGDLMAA